MSKVKAPAAPDLPQELAAFGEEPASLRDLELSERLVSGSDWSQRDATGARVTECRLEKVALDETKLDAKRGSSNQDSHA